jgi:ATP-binding cassette, subfamily C, bacterial
LDSMIGDRGIKLSGGERQRIALARALLSKPQLLILDEATSALDDANEQKIQSVLERLQGKLTIVIVAHRETTISHVDKRIELGKKALQQLPSSGQKIGNGR